MPSILRTPTRPIYLDSDADIEEEYRPTFYVKNMSVGEFLDFAGLLEDLAAATSNKARLTAALQCVSSCLTGWSNMRDPAKANALIPYSVDALKMIVTLDELTELVGKISGEQSLSKTDAKKSE